MPRVGLYSSEPTPGARCLFQDDAGSVGFSYRRICGGGDLGADRHLLGGISGYYGLKAVTADQVVAAAMVIAGTALVLAKAVPAGCCS